MSERVDEFFRALRENSKLRDEFYKIIKAYPEKKVMNDFGVEEQLKFICEVVIPFAKRHGFEFELIDIVFSNDIKELEDLSLGEISGGSNLGLKITASTLAAINMLSFVPPAVQYAKAGSVGSSLAITENESRETAKNYGNVLDVLKVSSQKLHPISEEYPLNEVDCLIMSTVSYLPLNFVPNLGSQQESITVSEWANKFFEYDKTKDKKLFAHEQDNHTINRYVKSNDDDSISDMDENRRQLLKLIGESPRYKDIKVGDFSGRYVDYAVGIKDSEQFAAVTFTLQDGTKVVSFRGTDGTMSGWKEDMDLSWSKKVLAQEHALEYLRKESELYSGSKFFVTGHSKGGNLALYSSFYLCNESQEFLDRLMGIVNYDGPGLNKEIVDDIKPDIFSEVSNRLITFIPQFSIIGRIMNGTVKHTIYCLYSGVTSALTQHDSMTWYIAYDYEKKDKANRFEKSEIQMESDFIESVLAFFVESVDRENAQRVFVQWLFDFMVKNNISMYETRTMYQIVNDILYDRFVRNKSTFDIINLILMPDTVMSLSDSEKYSFRDIIHKTFLSFLKTYWGMHLAVNNKMGISPELNKALEDLVRADYSWEEIYNTVKVIKNDAFSWKNIKNFLKKLYGV